MDGGLYVMCKGTVGGNVYGNMDVKQLGNMDVKQLGDVDVI